MTFVRVLLENGRTASVSPAIAEHAVKILNEPAVDGRGAALPEADPDSPDAQAAGYAAWTYSDLRNEIGRRNAGREGEQKMPATGTGEALVAVLEADDLTPTTIQED